MKALFIGRFQPFHKGHLQVLDKLADKYEFIIGIGSAQYGYTYDNPFTLEERKKMIQAALEETPIRYEIVAIPDIHNYPKWVDHVCSLTPSFDIVLSNNPLTRKLFREKGYKVEGTPLYNREVYSGEEIRRRISLDEPWEELVPSRVVRIIYSIGGVERIKKLYREGGEKTSFSKRINDTS